MTPELVQIKDYGKVVTPRILSQYQKALRLIGLVRAGCAAADSIEQAFFDIREGFWLRLAVGAQLDVLGRAYGVAREGRDDSSYRTQIQFRAATLVSGNPEELLVFLAVALGDVNTAYIPEYPAGFVITTSEGTIPTASLIPLAPAGVRAAFANPMFDAHGMAMQGADDQIMYAVRA